MIMRGEDHSRLSKPSTDVRAAARSSASVCARRRALGVSGTPDRVLDELVARYRALAAADDELTVVFDAGQNSAANFAHLAEVGLPFVGSLPPSEHPELLAVPARPWSTPNASAG
jgi:hypothetical protein